MINTNYPEKPALIFKDHVDSYNELFRKIGAYSQLFGGERYEKVAIFSENRPEWIYAFFAAWQNHSVVVPIDFLSSASDAAYILNDCKPGLAFVSRSLSQTWEKVTGMLQHQPVTVILDDVKAEDDALAAPRKISYDPDSSAVIIYTSGTTGSPKGVMLSFNNLLANVRAVTEDVRIFTAERPVLMLLPLHHIFPLAGSLLAPLAAGGCIVMSPSISAPMITFPRPGKVVLGTTGQALPGLQVEIRDGEVVAKGPNIMQGYFNRPEETAEVLKDGWLYTGDLGEIDFPDYGVLNEAGARDAEEYFREHVFPAFNKELTSYKRIMKFSLVKEELPRTRLGKIQRYMLEEMASARVHKQEQHYEHAESEEYLSVKSFLESQVDMTISPDDHLEFDIALDSLDKLSLIDFIEKRFGIKIEEEHLFKFPHVKSLVEHIRQHKRWSREEVTNWAAELKERVHVKLPKTWPTLAMFKNSARGFFSLYSGLKREGLENIPDGPCIFAPNHESFFD